MVTRDRAKRKATVARYYQRHKEENNFLDAIRKTFGDKCQLCGSQKRLQLHHKYYADGSVRPKSRNENGSRTLLRRKEAVAHPERFMYVCLACHNAIEPRKLKTRPRVGLKQQEVT